MWTKNGIKFYAKAVRTFQIDERYSDIVEKNNNVSNKIHGSR